MRSLFIGIVLFAYVVIIGGYTLYWNESGGGMVQGWYREYMDEDGEIHGSGKWRISFFRPDIRAGFQPFTFWFGSWVYPFSVISASIFIVKGWRQKNPRNKILLFGAAAISLCILAAFLDLGVFTAVNYFRQ